jgi:hypothetical protein
MRWTIARGPISHRVPVEDFSGKSPIRDKPNPRQTKMTDPRQKMIDPRQARSATSPIRDKIFYGLSTLKKTSIIHFILTPVPHIAKKLITFIFAHVIQKETGTRYTYSRVKHYSLLL